MTSALVEAKVEENVFLLEKVAKALPEMQRYIATRLIAKEARKQEWLENTFQGKLKKA